MAAATRASSASAKAAAKPAPAASTGTKRKAVAPAAKETPAKKVAVTPAKKETKAAPASKKAAAEKAEKKIVEEKKPVEKKPVEKKVVEKKPVEKKPVEKKPVEKKPVEKKPVEKKPVEKKPVEKKPVEKKPVEKKSVEKKPVEKKPVEKKPVEKKPVEKKPVEKKTPASKKAVTAQPKAVETLVEKEDQEEQEDDNEEEELMDDRTLLKDIDSSADEDSSDDENEEDKAAMKEDTFASMKDEISLNPKAAATLRKKLGAIGEPKDKNTTGVVYLGRIPHGFYEEQMKAYFTQFGKVLRLRLSRNKKTGKSKHYAFIEFASQEVADIVADTMNNYLLFGHLLKCKALQPSQIHPAMFQGANKRFKPIPWLKISKEKHNAEKSASQSNQVKKKLLRNEAAKRAKLAELGIDYEFPGYKASVQEKPKHTKF
ncbi:MKI67 FHA domain-interacting nucleolar phosphoprotein [Mortierella sp. AM989]|nr:MKI67 FHA domain-interacting nucleolar phosphoprotein [Mortierella sp. AM989]